MYFSIHFFDYEVFMIQDESLICWTQSRGRLYISSLYICFPNMSSINVFPLWNTIVHIIVICDARCKSFLYIYIAESHEKLDNSYVLQGLKTAIIEGDVVGGTCVNRGCVPSKALLAVSGRMRELQNEHHMKSFGLQVLLIITIKVNTCHVIHRFIESSSRLKGSEIISECTSIIMISENCTAIFPITILSSQTIQNRIMWIQIIFLPFVNENCIGRFIEVPMIA